MPQEMKVREFCLTVGPVLTYWTRKELASFYASVADTRADTIVLGEVVCSRRHEMKIDDWVDLASDLQATGKEVVLATMGLVESEADLRQLRRFVENGRFLVEAGDASAVRMATRMQLPFVIGPHINVYSAQALAFHVGIGASRWVAPVELPLQELGQINPPAAGGGQRVPTEAWAFGRLPLAFSARCFTARHHRLRKDDCQFRCADDPDGLLLSTDEGRPFLALNGIQTLSAGQHCLIGERDALRRAGVTRLRLSPVSRGFDAVVDCFERVMNDGEDAREARCELVDMALPGGLVDGFAHGRPGIEQVPA